MNSDDYQKAISNAAELYRLGLISYWYDNRFRQLGESYPEMNIKLFEEHVLRWLRGIAPSDGVIVHQGSFDEVVDENRLAQMTKLQFRDVLDQVKQKDPDLPDKQIYDEFCASIEAKKGMLINRDNRLN